MWTHELPTQAEINKLEQELQQKKRQVAEFNRKQILKKEQERKNTTKIDVHWSDDYYWADVWEYSFYYWYEETMCKKHHKTKDCEDRFDCDERERCFVVCKWDKEIMRLPTSDLQSWNIDETFVSWLMMFIQKLLDNQNIAEK